MPSKQPMGDVVVLLPGILGSVLERDGHEVWAMSPGAAWRAIRSLGHSVKDLELHGDDPSVDDLGDGVTAPRLQPDLHLIPGLWSIDGYSHVRSSIFATFDVVEGQNWFDFPYDWRRDNRVAARHLAERAPGWLQAWRQRSGNNDAKLVLVGHSMGGLVARHYLEVLGGWRDTRMLITFGTPYRGSLNALDFLCNGFKKKIGPVGLDLTRLLRSLTSVYQLLPRYPVVDSGSGPLTRIAETAGLPGVDPKRAAAALQFHLDIDDAIENRPANAYAIHPVVGILQPTLQSARLHNGSVELLRSYSDADNGGDGTVPRVSATPVELSDQGREIYAPDQHGSLQNSTGPLTQLIGLLSARPTSKFRGLLSGFGLELDEVFAAGEPISAVVTSDDPSLAVNAVVTDAATGRPVIESREEADGDGMYRAEWPPLPPADYRMTISSTDPNSEREPVHSVFIVADTETDPGDGPP
jgi:pimeloyl-ACP methyl ester carboxylesterase